MKLRIFIAGLLSIYITATSTAQINFTTYPSSMQVYPRNANDSATVNLSGIVNTPGFASAIFTLHRNGVLADSSTIILNYSGNNAPFQKSYNIRAEKSHYRFKMYLFDGSIATLINRADSVCSGDVYVVTGQSNAVSVANGPGADGMYLWVRSFGTESNIGATCQADTTWGMANGGSGNIHCGIGVWSLRLGKMLADTSGIPVCIINGARASSRIIDHMPYADHTDLDSYYGRLLYRAKKAHVEDKVKSLFWYQGESDTDTAYLQYANRFNLLYNAWKQDYSIQQKIAVVQIRPGCIITAGTIYHQQLREVLRNLEVGRPDVIVIPTVGLPEFDGCHFTTIGYQALSSQLYAQFCDDFIGKPQIAGSDAPHLKSAAYSNNSNTEVSLIFDQDMQWPNPFNGYDMKDYLYLNSSTTILSGACFHDTLKLQLSVSSNANRITYLPGIYYNGTTDVYQGPWLLNSRNVGTPTFYQFSIQNNLPITADRNPSICSADSVILSTTRTGQSYQWFRDSVIIIGATQQQYVAKTAGSYTLIMKDGDNISLTSNALVVSSGSGLKPVISTPNGRSVFCQGNSVILLCNQGASWLWSTGETTSSISVTGAGNYTVSISTLSGCTGVSDTFRLVLDIPSKPIITPEKSSICVGDSVKLSIGTFSSALWSNGSSQSFIYIVDTNLYSVTITDSIGCTAVSNPFSLSLSQPTSSVINTSAIRACPGQSIILTSGNPAVFYLWSTGQTTAGISATVSGIYTLTITDQNGCKGVSSGVELTIASPSISISPSGSKVICSGTSQVLTAVYNLTPGTFQWYKSSVAIANANSATYTTTATGSYTVRYTDIYGCSATSAATSITVSALPAATFIVTDQLDFCNDSIVTLTANTAAGLSYQWQKDLVDIPGANNLIYVTLTKGSYRVITTSTAGCTKVATAKAIPVVSPPPVATFTVTNETDFCNDSIVTLTANTTAGLSYQWQKDLTDIPGANNLIYFTQTKGSYRVITTNAAGCTKAATAKTIPIVSPPPIATFTVTDQFDFCNDSIVTLTANTAIGLSYQWQKDLADISGANNLVYVTQAKGSYRVITTNTAGCTKAATAKIIPITSPTPIATFTVADQLDVCQDTVATLTANTATDITYQWQKNLVSIAGATNQIYSTQSRGSYRVITTNAIGCTKAATAITLPVIDPIATVSASGILSFCTGDSVILNANSGNNYSYQWLLVSTAITGAVQQAYSAKSTGNYRVRVTNAIGCTALSSYKIVTVSNCGSRLNSETTEDNGTNELAIYPQPFTEEFTLQLPFEPLDNTNYYFEIRNVASSQVMRLDQLLFNNNQATINAETLAPGLYFYQLISNKNIYHGRLIKR